ncbi:hypothetical protein [Fusobacterium varium]|uniref:hypothetical protein n=1 Tax=Fusobacterium varium TaxID=856 RepID=UPI0030D83CD8
MEEIELLKKSYNELKESIQKIKILNALRETNCEMEKKAIERDLESIIRILGHYANVLTVITIQCLIIILLILYKG